MRFLPKKYSFLIFLTVIAAWIFFLRWPYFARPAWNLDEGIHATIARSILDGGIMYRDSIDQRTPLTYYLVAGLFRLFGENNMWALHAVLAALIVATAGGIYLIARRWRSEAMGRWSALIYCALTTNLLYIGDAYSLSTEWFVAFFSTWATWWFWRTWNEKTFWKPALAGLGFAAAFLSKQPGLLEIGAPLATLVYAVVAGRLHFRHSFIQISGLCSGWIVATAAVIGYFWSHGALKDFYFYAWTYNLAYYGPETTGINRLQAALAGITQVWQHYPVICAAIAVTALRFAIRLVQFRSWRGVGGKEPVVFYLMTWAFLSCAGSASAGRIYGHYYIQTLPSLSLLAAWLFADCQSYPAISRNKIVRGGCLLILIVAAWSVIAVPLKGPWPAKVQPEAGMDVADFVRTHSRPEDKIFVWGYNPDFYLYADRRSASRYIYCSFLTGMIPWTNTGPGVDTRYAIVPGTMDILLTELGRTRPEFIVDTSLGTYRRFDKYPIEAFPRLRDFILLNYVVAESTKFEPHGFRLHLLKDSGRIKPLPLAGGSPDRLLTPPVLTGPTQVDLAPVGYVVDASHPTGRLQRIELLADGKVVDGTTFQPTSEMEIKFTVPFRKLGKGRHELMARSTDSSGETKNSQPLTVECGPQSLAAEKLPAFALPIAGRGMAPIEVRAPFGAYSRMEAGRLVFGTHAPATIRYVITGSEARLRGKFGFKPGAWAPENPSKTDGAEFIISCLSRDGQKVELLRRPLRPVEIPADRTEQEFNVELPAGARELDLIVTNGPAGNASSDWTYWVDLMLLNSR